MSGEYQILESIGLWVFSPLLSPNIHTPLYATWPLLQMTFCSQQIGFVILSKEWRAWIIQWKLLERRRNKKALFPPWVRSIFLRLVKQVYPSRFLIIGSKIHFRYLHSLEVPMFCWLGWFWNMARNVHHSFLWAILYVICCFSTSHPLFC